LTDRIAALRKDLADSQAAAANPALPNYANPMLLFLGLLTLLNAPFVWVSLGLTRALLRWGLELGGWWMVRRHHATQRALERSRGIAQIGRVAKG
jgi:hypothetical protein